jgi:hypothetical protein
MVLFRALGWLLLAMAVMAIVSDCLAWWSEGAFRLLPLGELWSRLDYGSLHGFQEMLESRFYGRLWRFIAMPILRLPALPVFLVGGTILLWIGRRIGSRAEPRFVTGSRPPRRRRRSGIS